MMLVSSESGPTPAYRKCYDFIQEAPETRVTVDPSFNVWKRACGDVVVPFLLADMPGMAEPFRVPHNQSFPPFSELNNGQSEGLAIEQ